jgi:brefeldin A-inhibited guanine nucleotide-exchange protein
VRTAWNIFLLSRSSQVQIIAQATLTQMIQAIFARLERVPNVIHISDSLIVASLGENPVSLDSAGKVESDSNTSITVVDPDGFVVLPDVVADSPATRNISDIHINDVFLVFRALCKLSMKIIPATDRFAYNILFVVRLI